MLYAPKYGGGMRNLMPRLLAQQWRPSASNIQQSWQTTAKQLSA